MSERHICPKCRRVSFDSPLVTCHVCDEITRGRTITLAAKAHKGTLTVDEARCLLRALTLDSLPKPMLRWDDNAQDATTVQDLQELMGIVMDVINNAPTKPPTIL